MQQEHACLASGSLSVNYIITIHNPLDIKFIANIEYIYIYLDTNVCIRMYESLRIQISELRTVVIIVQYGVISYKYGYNYGSVTCAAAWRHLGCLEPCHD